MTIQRLPDEMLEHIISLVPPQDIPVLMGVCKQWARIIRGPTICTILFQHRCPGLTCDRRTACAKWFKQKQLYENIKAQHPRLTCDRRTAYAKWFKQKQLYENIKAQRFTTSHEELSSEYVFLGDQLYSRFYGSIHAAYIFKEFIVAQIDFKLRIIKEGQLLRSYDCLFFLGIEEECILCWDRLTDKIISIDARFNLHAEHIYCNDKPVVWGPFLYYHDRSTKEIIQIDRRDHMRKQICALPKRYCLHANDSLLYCSCLDYPRRWATVIDMQTGTLVRQVDTTGTPIGCDRDRYFTLSDNNVLHACNRRGELEQTYGGIQKRPFPEEARVTSFKYCTVYTDSEDVLTSCSTYIWNSKTGKLLATFPYQFIREDQGKLYFFDKSRRRLIICDYTQPDLMQV